MTKSTRARKKSTYMGRKGPRAKTKTVLKPVKQWEKHGSMPNSEFLTFLNKNHPNPVLSTQYPVSCIRYAVSSIRCAVSSIQYPVNSIHYTKLQCQFSIWPHILYKKTTYIIHRKVREYCGLPSINSFSELNNTVEEASLSREIGSMVILMTPSGDDPATGVRLRPPRRCWPRGMKQNKS